MDIIRKCKDCEVGKSGSITVCGDIEHLCALDKIAKFPISKQRAQISTQIGGPEPSWELTHKTCPEITKGYDGQPCPGAGTYHPFQVSSVALTHHHGADPGREYGGG